MSPHLVEMLHTWGPAEGLIVIPRGAQQRLDYEAFRRAWKRSGHPQRQPFHGLRKAFASELRRRGVQLDVIRQLVGHAHGTTGDVYLDPYAMADEMREAVGLIPPIMIAQSA